MKDIIEKNSLKIKQIIKNFTGEYNEDLEQEVYIKTYKNLQYFLLNSEMQIKEENSSVSLVGRLF